MSESKYGRLTDNDLVAMYEAAMHAVQSGVAHEHSLGSKDQTPKHLRVGIAGNKITELAVATLLIEKGIITRREYLEANLDAAIAEKKAYEERNGVTFA